MIPFHLLAKPTSARCNLSCSYCFFLSKENLHADGDRMWMDDATLDRTIRQLFEASPGPQVDVAWQGGEPLLRGIDFYRRSVALAERYRRPHHRVVQHTMQTNGTLIDDAWARFFKENRYLVGLSVDGPRAMHDAYRKDTQGKGSFDDVMRGWEVLRRHDVDVNILCTVHAANADHPLDVYRFFRDELGAAYIQIIPIVERATPETLAVANQGWRGGRGTDRPLYRQEGSLVTDRSVTAEQWGRFLTTIFDEWVRRDVGRVFVTTFDVALGSWLGQHNACVVAPTCGAALAMEHNGDVYTCDHYVEPDHKLGNIKDTSLAALVASEKARRFGEAKSATLPRACRACPVLFACYGECPRNRFIETADGEPGLNYLCAGYKAFFTHIDRPIRMMAALLQQGRYADEVMPLLRAEAASGTGPRT